MHSVRAEVNGEEIEAVVEARLTLLDFLRDHVGLTGTHSGCEQGACGACTVLFDHDVVRSCLVLAVQADGQSVTTVEAVGTPEHLHPVQEAFRAHHGLQCGYCTPGMVLTAIDLLDRVEAPDEVEVRTALAGNLCRCTGYTGLVEAIVELGRDRATAEARTPGPGGSETRPARVDSGTRPVAPTLSSRSEGSPVLDDRAGL